MQKGVNIKMWTDKHKIDDKCLRKHVERHIQLMAGTFKPPLNLGILHTQDII